MTGTDEALNEALVELARSRERVRVLREESEVVLAGLRVLATATDPGEMVLDMFDVLKPLLGFTQALAVLPAAGGPQFVSTHGANPPWAWPLAQVTELCAQGPAAVFNRMWLPDLSVIPIDGESLLLATFPMTHGFGVLVFATPQCGYFTDRHLAVLRRLGPLLSESARASAQRDRDRGDALSRLARYPGMNPRPVLEVQLDGTVVYRNAAATALLGTSATLPDDWLVHALRAARAARPGSFDVSFGERILELVMAPATEHTVIVYAFDVTERVEVERSAVAANIRLSTLIGSLHMGILVEDEYRMAVLANEGLTQMFGIPLPPFALVGTDCAKSSAQTAALFQDNGRFEERVRQIVGAHERVVGEVLPMKDGRVLERDYIPVVLDGRSAGHMWLYRDVTAGHRIRQELRAAKRMADDASQAKSDFLAGMSHEIRTPLNAILGMSELLTATQLTDEQQAWLSSIRSNGETLLDVITDVLDLSKIEAGQLTIEPNAFSVRGWLESIVESISHRAHAKGLAIRVFLDPEMPDTVVGDGARLRQVLVNLIANAIRFTDKGEVSIRVSGRPSRGVDGTVMRVDVRDTGVGISKEGMAVIFDKYGQADGASRGGTGLGLHITRRILTAMSGNISVNSVVGQGSRFTVRIPLQVTSASQPERLTQLRAACSGLRVAVLASPEVRAIFNDALAGAPLSFVSSRDAQVWLTGGSVKPPRGPIPLVLASPVGVPVNPTAAQVANRRVYAHFAQERILEAMLEAIGKPLPHPTSGTQPTHVRPWRVLLAEDNMANQVVATGMLESAGHEVVVANDGQRAVQLANGGDWDVILMDVDMPILNGVEATRQIRESERRACMRSVPIVGLTAHATPDIREAALDAGMDAFEAKPIRRSTLLRTLDRVVRSAARVLVVDDAADIRRYFQSILDGMGRLTVRACSSGSQAVLELRTWPADLVLMDVEMPGMSGIEAVGVLRQEGFSGRVVAVTGHDSAEAHATFLRAGYDDVFIKPIRSERLTSAVTGWLRPEPEAGTPVAIPRRVQVPDDLRELVPAFLQDRDDDVERLFMAVKSEDWETIRRIGHRLKGSGGSYGFPRISELGAELERNAGHVPVEILAASLRKLHRHVAAIYDELGGRPAPKTFDER